MFGYNDTAKSPMLTVTPSKGVDVNGESCSVIDIYQVQCTNVD